MLQSTGAQNSLHALKSLQVSNGIYRHSADGISVQNAILFVPQFQQFTRNVILCRYFRTTRTWRKERKAPHACHIPSETLLAHIIIQEFLSENAMKFVYNFVSSGLCNPEG